jgi:hypothetical protein
LAKLLIFISFYFSMSFQSSRFAAIIPRRFRPASHSPIFCFFYTIFYSAPKTLPISSPTPPPPAVAGKAREMTKERTIRKSAKDY